MKILPYLLQKHDVFQFGNASLEYFVTKVVGEVITYKSNKNRKGGTAHKMSSNSKLKLTLVEDGDFKCPPDELHKHILFVPENSIILDTA